MCILYVFLQATGTTKETTKVSRKKFKKAAKYLCLQVVSSILTCCVFVFGNRKIRKAAPEHVESPARKVSRKDLKQVSRRVSGKDPNAKYLCLQVVSAILTCCVFVFGNRRTLTRKAVQKVDTEILCALPCMLWCLTSCFDFTGSSRMAPEARDRPTLSVHL